MKKITLFLSFLLALVGTNAQTDIRHGINVTAFPWVGGVTTETRPYFDYSVLEPWAGARIYQDLAKEGTTPVYAEIDRSQTPNSIGPIAWDHPYSATGWRLDSAYAYAKAQGVELLFCLQGAFSNQELRPGASTRKHPAIDDSADPNSVLSYIPFAELYAQQVLRYGPTKNDDAVAPLRVVPGNTFLTEVVRSGLNYAWGHQAGNEDNFPWNGGVVLTAYQSGIKFAACYNFARDVSPDARLVMPSFLGATFQYLEEFIAGFQDGCAQLGREPKYDWYAAFHRYHRVGGMGQTQGADTGASPESVQAHLLFEGMVEVAERYGLQGVLCTETGWNDDPRPEAIKQVAPLQEGFTLSESVALMAIRNALIAQASGVERVYNYHYAEIYEGQPYTHTGWTFDTWHPTHGSTQQWSWKPQALLLFDWLDRYGDYTVLRGSFRETSGVYSVAVSLAGLPVGELRWTDGKTIGPYTPLPTLFVTEPPVVEPPAPDPVQIFFGDTVEVEKVGRKRYRVIKP